MPITRHPALSQLNSTAIAAFLLLMIAFLFGGASRQHELRLALVEIAALPLLVIAVTALLRQGDIGRHRFALCILAAAACLPLLQLIPLPASIWTALPGREQAVLALELTGLSPGWVPLSLTPDRTWRSFLALVPPVAMFVGILCLRPSFHRPVAYIVLGLVTFAVLLGAAQLVSGGVQLYFWRTTDAGTVAGVFANRNHLATLCLLSMPFAAALGAGALRRNERNLRLWLSVLFVGLMVIFIGVIRSRAGIVLLGPSLALSALAAWIAAGRGRPNPQLLSLAGAAAAGAVAVALFALPPLLERFDRGSSAEGRFENWPIVAAAANDYLPLGSGLGSFDTIYRSVEPPAQLDATFFNQAHNEYLETWLEAGWLGVALIAAFFVWFTRRSWTAWRARSTTARDLQRAASIAVGLVLLHSIVEYPLRTETISVIFALCCGLLELTSRSDSELNDDRRERRRQSA